MTARTDHPTIITPELGALAELIYLVEILLEDAFVPNEDNAAAFDAFDKALEQSKALVFERLSVRARLARDAGPRTAHVQLQAALIDELGEKRA